MSEAAAAAARSGGPRLMQLLPVDALVASGATTPAYTDEMVATVEQLGPCIVIAPGIAPSHRYRPGDVRAVTRR